MLRRSSFLVLVAAIAASLVVAPVSARASGGSSTTAAPGVEEAEALVIELINERRDQQGLRRLRLDSRIAKIARARSEDMIDRRYFSHTDPDGNVARTFLNRAKVRFTRVSEIIAWNRDSDLLASAEQAVDAWMKSSVHRREILSTAHNYFGAGVAADGSTVKWTVISITGPDRTDPVARITSVSLIGDRAAIRWTGSDPRLVVGTAGLRDYDLARRHPGGDWIIVRDNTTKTSTSSSAMEGSEFRVRARDDAGNVGAWSSPVAAVPSA